MVGCMYHVPFVSLFVVLATIYVAHAIDFDVINEAKHTSGGQLFDKTVGVEKTRKIMVLAPFNICQLGFRHDFGHKKHVKKITLVIFFDLTQLDSCSYHTDKVKGFYEIRLGERHLQSCEDFMKKEITMMIYYEMAQILQMEPQSILSNTLIKGIAAFVVLRVGCKPERWVKYGEGLRWNENHDVTAQFLVYCDSKFTDFVRNLNKKMKTYYSPRYFVELTENTIDKVWLDYKESIYGPMKKNSSH